MATRKIVHIDEDACTGCGQCVPACAEGAIQIIDGKAKLVSEIYCDGLGACLGTCPEDAITIEQREADAFDAEAVQRHLAAEKTPTPHGHAHRGSCPGSAVRTLNRPDAPSTQPSPAGRPSKLTNWPVQLRLVPACAPFLDGADLVIAADCVPCASADFHERFLDGRVLLVGCPKLDDAAYYEKKLTDIFSQNDIRSVQVAYMEVPCCHALVHVVESAIEKSGKAIPRTLTKQAIDGSVCERHRGNTPRTA